MRIPEFAQHWLIVRTHNDAHIWTWDPSESVATPDLYAEVAAARKIVGAPSIDQAVPNDPWTVEICDGLYPAAYFELAPEVVRDEDAPDDEDATDRGMAIVARNGVTLHPGMPSDPENEQ